LNQSEAQSITQVQDRIVREFGIFQDWTERYEHLIRLGKKLPAIDESTRTEDNKVHGCQSQVWLYATNENGVIHYQADSDALIVKGLIALLLRVYNDRSPQEIIKTEPDFINKIGLDRHLSPTRANGLAAMMKRIKYDAIKLTAK